MAPKKHYPLYPYEIGGRGFSELSVFFESFVFSEFSIVGKSTDGISGSDE